MTVNKRVHRADLVIPPIGCAIIAAVVLLILIVGWFA